MNELMVSRARWSLLPLLRPPSGPDSDSGATTSANASPEGSPRPTLAHPSPSAATSAAPGASGGFRTRMRHMRDKIRRRVAQTGDWPPPGAIFGDRYSVSSGIGAMLAAGRQIPTPGAAMGGHWSAPPSRKTYPSSKRPVESFPLKKRSGSEVGAKAKGNGSGSGNGNGGGGGGAKKGGIVCSEMDMNAIIAGFREFEKSIRILHHTSGVPEAGEETEPAPGATPPASPPAIVVESPSAAAASDRSPSPSPKRGKRVSFDDRAPADTADAAAPGPEEAPGPAKRKQSPKEIEFDEFGQTWDVYGAEFDPELLGLAIQRRLDRMMSREEEEGGVKEATGGEDDRQRCERLRDIWRRLSCLARRHHKCPAGAAATASD